MATRTSNIDVMLRMRGQRAFAAQARAAGVELEGMGVRGAAALGRFAAQADRLKAFGRRWTRSVTLPILAAGGASVKMFADFDDSMNKMVGLVGLSRGQVQGWHEDVLSLSQETAVAPTELADAMFFITSAGFRGQEALDALRSSAMGAAAGLGETKTIATAVTGALETYADSGLTAERATDVLVAAVKEGRLEADQLAGTFGRLLDPASELGVGFDEVAGSLAQMSKTNENASQIATAYSGVLSTMLKPSTSMKDALDEMDLSVEKVHRRIGKRGLADTLAMLRRRAEEANIPLTELFPEKRALLGFLALTKDAEATADTLEGVAKSAGLTKNAFKEAQETAGFQFRKMLNNLKIAAIRFGAAIGPAVTPIVEGFGKAIGGIAERFSKLPKWMQTGTVATLGLLAAVGPTAWMLGFLAAQVGRLLKLMLLFAKAIAFVRAGGLAWIVGLALAKVRLLAMAVATKVATAATWLFNLALRANPLVMIATLIAAVVAALVILQLRFNIFGKTAQFVARIAVKAWQWIRDAVTNAVGAILGFLRKRWPLIVAILGGPLGAAVVLLIKHWDKIKAGAKAVLGFVKARFNDMIGFFRGLPGRIASAAEGLFDGIKDAFRSAINFIIRGWNKLNFRIDPGKISIPGPIPDIDIPGVTLGTPRMPELGAGGRIVRGGAAIVGESGPEVRFMPTGAVVEPLPVGGLAAAVGGGGRVTHVHKIYVGRRQVAEAVAEEAEDAQARR